MSDDWLPRLKTKPVDALIVGERGPELRQVPAQPMEVSVRVEKEVAGAPRGWRFVPERDANNLIVEIIATPI